MPKNSVWWRYKPGFYFFFLARNKNEIYPLNYLLPIGVMLTISKFFTIFFLISLPVGIDSSFKWVPKYILFLAKLKGGRLLFGGGRGREFSVRLQQRALCYCKETKQLSFWEIWDNWTSPLPFIRLPYKYISGPVKRVPLPIK